MRTLGWVPVALAPLIVLPALAAPATAATAVATPAAAPARAADRAIATDRWMGQIYRHARGTRLTSMLIPGTHPASRR